MTWLIYVRGLRGPCPQIIHDGGDKPLITEGIRGHVLAEHKLSPAEEVLSFAELMKRYQPPGASDAPSTDDPAPLAPAPASPDPSSGATEALEVA